MAMTYNIYARPVTRKLLQDSELLSIVADVVVLCRRCCCLVSHIPFTET